MTPKVKCHKCQGLRGGTPVTNSGHKFAHFVATSYRKFRQPPLARFVGQLATKRLPVALVVNPFGGLALVAPYVLSVASIGVGLATTGNLMATCRPTTNPLQLQRLVTEAKIFRLGLALMPLRKP